MSAEDHSGLYKKVLGSLLVLTVVTVWVSTIHFGRVGNITVGILVAIVKASLVTLIFMHMKWEKKWWLSIVLFPLALVMIIIFANFADTGLNDDFTTPALEKIPHTGGGSSGAKH